MKQTKAIHSILVLILLCLLSGCEKQRPKVLGGGPTGGSLGNLAIELKRLLTSDMPGIPVEIESSAGSIENLAKVDSGEMDMALVYAEDAYRGRLGVLSPVPKATLHVRAVAKLFDAAAHLIVPQKSPVNTPFDLHNKRVAIGNPGSGSAVSAKSFFSSIGVWDQIIPIYVGFKQGMSELKQREIDALWMLSGFPNGILQEAIHKFPVRLLNLFDAAAQSPFFQDYPFYSLAVIPADSYQWQTQDCYTFKDEVLWVAHDTLDADFVYQSLKTLFSHKGMDQLRSALPVAWGFDINESLIGVKIPLHPGAIHFLQESL